MPSKTAYVRIADAVEITSKTLEKMEENLKTLNDSNILHQSNTTSEHKAFSDKMTTVDTGIKEKLEVMTSKYWYLVLVAFILLALIAGVKEAARLLPGG